MMKVLVTVGTTRFEGLIKAIDVPMPDDINIFFQIADGTYEPQHHSYERFISNLPDRFKGVDLVVCHAGAGTLYRLLEEKKPTLVVPNLERFDKHQEELAWFVKKNNYAEVALLEELDRHTLIDLMNKALTQSYERYEKDPFFKIGEVLNYFGVR